MSEERTSQEAQRASVDHFRKEHMTPSPEVSVEALRSACQGVVEWWDAESTPEKQPDFVATCRAALKCFTTRSETHYHFYCPEGSILSAAGSVVSIVPAPMRKEGYVLQFKPCNAVPIDPECEAACAEPFHWDDGVPYCNTCGLYRNSKHRGRGT